MCQDLIIENAQIKETMALNISLFNKIVNAMIRQRGIRPRTGLNIFKDHREKSAELKQIEAEERIIKKRLDRMELET